MPESQRPNIVLIMVDDADRKVLEHHASARIRAAIANEGATATRYLINHPLCAPSRASLLRGRYPHNTGVVGNTGAYDNFVVNGGEDSNIAVWLQAAGYRTAMIGKYLNGYEVSDLEVPPGWDYWFVVGQDAYDSYEYPVNDNGRYDYYESEDTDYLTDVLKRKALEFLGSPPVRVARAVPAGGDPDGPARPSRPGRPGIGSST